MKKLIVLLMIVIFTVSFGLIGIGCKEEAAPEEETVKEEAAPAEETMEEDISGTLEIFSWWTAGGEAEGLDALMNIYKEKFPNVEFINATVAGGAGAEAKPVLASRMTGGDPPDSFQVLAGPGLVETWGSTGLLEPINFIFEEEGWLDVFPSDIVNIVSMDGDIFAVPVNVHRTNITWYNPLVFENIGAEPPTTFDEFFAVSEILEGEGIIPLALGDSYIVEALTVYENVLLGILGPEDYIGLFDGSVRWDSDGVEEATMIFVKMLDYVNDDHAAIVDVDAAQYVADGVAAMTISGDWQSGYFKSKGLVPNEDFGYIPSPETEGSFNGLSDTFCLPLNAKNRSAAVEWLKVCGSKEGQDAFNPLKGSIPARTDADVSLYDAYSKYSIEEYAKDVITPSMAGGAAVSEAWQVDIEDILTTLVTDKNVENAISAFQTAAENNLK